MLEMEAGTEDRARVLKSRVLWHSVAWGLTGLFLGGVVEYLPFTARRLGASSTMVSLLVGLPSVSLMFAFTYMHHLEHFEGRMLVAAPRVLGCVVLLFMALAGTPMVFILVGAAAMLAFRVTDAFYGNLLGRLYPAQQRGRLLILPMLSMTGMTVLGNMLGGHLLDMSTESYRWEMPAVSVVGILGACVVMRLPVRASGERHPHSGITTCIREAMANRRFALWTLLYSLMCVGFWVAYPASAIYFSDELGVSNTGFGVARAAYNIAVVVGYLAFGRFLDSRGSVVTICFGWMGISAGLSLLAMSGDLRLALVGQMLQGVGMGANDIAWFPVVLEYAPRRYVHRYMAFYMTMLGVRGVVGTAAASVLMDGLGLSSRITLLLGSAAIGVVAVLTLLIRKRVKPLLNNG